MRRFAHLWRDPVLWGGAIVYLVTQTVYLMTMNISCPFWDSGEFIATSYTMGIPHPPGTPLYVLLGRVFSFLPIGQIATRVNLLSAVPSALAVLFTYAIIVNFIRRWNRGAERAIDRWIAVAGGMAGAFFMAFSRTFWDNAIEAEVYALSSFAMVLGVWLVLKWEGSLRGTQRNDNLLVLIGYLLFVAVGFHMGALLVAPPLFLYVLLIAPQTVFNRRFLLSLLSIFGAGLLFFLLRGAGASVGLSLATGGLAFICLVLWKWDLLGRRNLGFWLLAVAVLGLTVQLFLLVRARLDPMINEADPSTWSNLWLVLSRDQYKPPNPFDLRQASYAVQFTKHFWRYWHDQFHLGLNPAWFAMALPFGIGLLGGIGQFLRDRKRFAFMLGLLFMTTVFLVFYLNFKENEVRDRDYFFVAGYHFFAIWIGLGVAMIARWLRGEPQVVGKEVREAPGGRLFGLGACGILVALSFFPMVHGWHAHDRTRFLIARDYAFNMLYPLEEDAIVFTNGDNDTFPLWYLQEVEGIRKDVRVVNLSLLNTPWYIRQVRDYEPSLRVTVPDDEIDRLRGVMLPDGRVVLIKDMMVHHIVEENPDRPIYLAVTVPEQMELEERLVMEGLVFRVVEEEGEPERVDVQKTWENLRNVYLYRGLLDEQGYFDASIFKDATARKLVQNYVAGYVRVAQHHLERDDRGAAIEALEYARRINPSYPGVLYTLGILWMEEERYDRAEESYRQMLELGERSLDTYRLLGAALEPQGRLADVEALYRDAVRVHPESFDAYRILFTHLWSVGEQSAAVRVIESWLERHPEDEATRAALTELRAAPPESLAPATEESTGAEGGAEPPGPGGAAEGAR